MLFLNYTFHMQSPSCWLQFGPSAQKEQLQRKEDQRQVGGSICTYTEIISLEEFTLLRALPREGMRGFKCGWVRRFHFADGLEGNYQFDEHRASLGFQDTLCELAFQASFPCFPSHCSFSLSVSLCLSVSLALSLFPPNYSHLQFHVNSEKSQRGTKSNLCFFHSSKNPKGTTLPSRHVFERLETKQNVLRNTQRLGPGDKAM